MAGGAPALMTGLLKDEDGAETSGARIRHLWSREREDAAVRGVAPHLWKAVWRAARTRILVTIFISLFVNILQFLGPVSCWGWASDLEEEETRTARERWIEEGSGRGATMPQNLVAPDAFYFRPLTRICGVHGKASVAAGGPERRMAPAPQVFASRAGRLLRLTWGSLSLLSERVAEAHSGLHR